MMLESKEMKTVRIDSEGGTALHRGNDVGDRDHPIPRRLQKRSSASRRTLEIGKRLFDIEGGF